MDLSTFRWMSQPTSSETELAEVGLVKSRTVKIALLTRLIYQWRMSRVISKYRQGKRKRGALHKTIIWDQFPKNLWKIISVGVKVFIKED